MKKAIVVIAAAALGAAVYFAARQNGEEAAFRTVKARRGDLVEAVTASGVVNPVNTVLVGTQVSGTISRIYADFNSAVKKGQMIAEIDPALLEARLEQTRANLKQAMADLDVANAQLLNARRDRDRKKALLEKEIIPQSDFDSAETSYVSSRAQVSAAKARVAQADASLRQDETNLRYTRIVSPVDGIVISRNVNVGQTVAASFQTPTLFTIAEDLTKMQIDTSVDEADIGKVSEGMGVGFTVDSYPETTFRGEVSQVRLAPTTVENVVTYNVVVMVENPGLKLKPGMTATVSIIISRRENALMVPNAALTFTNPGQGRPARYETQGVWVLRKGKPVRVDIKTGINNGEYAEITEGDIGEDDEVIVESLTGPGRAAPRGRGWGFL